MTGGRVAQAACAGDCNGDGHVTVDEVLVLVNMALGAYPDPPGPPSCPPSDLNHDGQVTVDEILAGVNNALNGCTEQLGVTEYAVPADQSFPTMLTTGPDGNLWFTENWISGVQGNIGRITPEGVVTHFAAGEGLTGITAGPDGNLWFGQLISHATGPSGNVGQITPDGIVTAFPIPTGAGVADISRGPDGNLWFTEQAYAAGQNGMPPMMSGAIGQMTPTGAVTEFALPAGAGGGSITFGPDGNLWFVEVYLRAGSMILSEGIGRITTAGTLTEFALPSSTVLARGITAGPDGNLWFTEMQFTARGTSLTVKGGAIGRITPEGVITEFPVALQGTLGGITAGTDGNLWFTETAVTYTPQYQIAGATGRIGRITPAGVITMFPLSGQVGPGDITLGPDEHLWFTDILNKIGRITQ